MLDIVVTQDLQDQVNLATSVNADGPITYFVFDPLSSPRTGFFGGNTKLADVDNDGDLDVGIAPIEVDIQNCDFSDDFALLRNDGAGHLADPWSAADDQNFHLDPHDFGFLDVNNDGCLDIFMGLCTGWRVFIQADCIVPCPWDLDGSGAVDITDFLALLAAWGTDPGGPPDFDGDGDVGITDFLELLEHWGKC